MDQAGTPGGPRPGQSTKYRIYLDEVGNPDLGSSDNPNHRFLSLTGVVLELGYVEAVLHAEMEGLKRKYFRSHPDDPVILHRKEMVNRRPPFETLAQDAVRLNFDTDLLHFLEAWQYTVISVCLDKKRHKETYQVWRYDPYHYCLAVLLERYVLWLNRHSSRGDVMAESRGGKEDRRLAKSFHLLFSSGTEYLSPATIAASLTSCQLKVKPKANNVAGLQVADLVAHPSFKASLHRHKDLPKPTSFGQQIADMLERTKYDRRPDGSVEGWGRKWLP